MQSEIERKGFELIPIPLGYEGILWCGMCLAFSADNPPLSYNTDTRQWEQIDFPAGMQLYEIDMRRVY